MNLVIDLPEEIDRVLTEEAGRHGLAPSDYARELIERQLSPANGLNRKPSARGKYAWVGTSSEEFAARKQAEIEIEDRGWRSPGE